MSGLAACSISYLNQLEVCYLIIERHLNRRQKETINELFMSLPEGIIVYNKEGLEPGANTTGNHNVTESVYSS
jgi:hypothetical protein